MAAVSSTLLSYGRGSRGLRDAGPYWCLLPAALDVLLDIGAAEAADVVFLCCLGAGAARVGVAALFCPCGGGGGLGRTGAGEGGRGAGEGGGGEGAGGLMGCAGAGEGGGGAGGLMGAGEGGEASGLMRRVGADEEGGGEECGT